MNKLLIPVFLFHLLTPAVSATVPMSPSAGKTLANTWKQANVTRFPVRISEPRGLGRTFETEERELILIIDRNETEVEQRARRALREANQRYWQRRIESQTMMEGGWYPEEAGWITPEGDPVVNKWPWWVW